MKRLTKNVILGVSMMLALAVSGLWKWSFIRNELLGFEWSASPERGTHLVCLQMVWGQMSIRWIDLQSPQGTPSGYVRKSTGWRHISSPINGNYDYLPAHIEIEEESKFHTLKAWHGFQYEWYPLQNHWLQSSDPENASAGVQFGAGWVREIWIPLWAPTLFFWIPPTIILVRRFLRRRRARLRGLQRLCTKCKYDLRGHDDGETCPECGTSIEIPRICTNVLRP